MQCTEQLLMLCFACAQAVERRAMLISSIAAATVDWIQQRRVRPHLNPCSYQLQLLGFQRVLEFGLTLQRISNLISIVKKKKKNHFQAGNAFLSSFVSVLQKEMGFVPHITGSQAGFLFVFLFFLLSHMIFFFWFHFTAFQVGANGWMKLDSASSLRAQPAFTSFSSSTYEIKPSKTNQPNKQKYPQHHQQKPSSQLQVSGGQRKWN